MELKKIKLKMKETPVTWAIFFITVMVFIIANVIKFENIRFLALMYEDFPQRWYTIITYSIVHLEWYHIIINMSILIFIGSWVEKLIGKKRYILLIVLSVLAGGITILLRETGGIGFSAAGYGIFFYYYLAFPMEREAPFRIPNIVFPALLLIASVLAIIFNWLPKVGHHPHIAGAAVGTLLLLLFRKKHKDLKNDV